MIAHAQCVVRIHLAVVYAAVIGFFDDAIHQSPDEFSPIMKHARPLPHRR
jgi:hypothetical protein